MEVVVVLDLEHVEEEGCCLVVEEFKYERRHRSMDPGQYQECM
jgi:hypothetical protein